MLQGTDRIPGYRGSLRGGTSTNGTHRAPPDNTAHRRSSGPSHHRRFCCPPGSTGTTAASDAHPASHPLPGSSRLSDATLRQHHPQAAGPGRASPVPAATLDTFRAPYAGEFLTAAPPGSSPLPWPSPWLRGLGTPLPRPHRREWSRRRRLRVMLRTASSLPLTGLLTLGFDPARFQTRPPACYQASWQLPGPDSHRQATTSLRTRRSTMA
jgi:hypothetical protein